MIPRRIWEVIALKEVLLIDCCIRRESSRTRRLAQAFVNALDPARFHVTVLDPEAEGLRPLTGVFFQAREELLARGELDHPRFRYARQLAQADLVVFAAPFWDLSFPAILKIYIENVCVEGITFACDEEGLHGSCKASRMVFLTTRGAVYGGSPLEQGSRYLEAMARFFGIPAYSCIAADGMDLGDPASPLAGACEQAEALARSR